MTLLRGFFLFFVVQMIAGMPAQSHRGSHGQPIPPRVEFDLPLSQDNPKEISERVESWSPDDATNIWELSGLFEGDIVLSPNDRSVKNGLVDAAMRWPNGIVPVFIREDDFDQEDISKIAAAINEFHERTCLVFTAYNDTNEDYVVFQSKLPGCWSSVGRQGKGQVINLQNPNCLKHGTIVHEILHAVGFYHQQSASDRDDFVTIHWENIKTDKKHNFKKYDVLTVTDYDIGYDYKSLMHYSSKAFSKNGNATITPLKEGVKIGQRRKMSKKDVTKLEAMYKDQCNGRKPKNSQGNDNGINVILDFLTAALS